MEQVEAQKQKTCVDPSVMKAVRRALETIARGRLRGSESALVAYIALGALDGEAWVKVSGLQGGTLPYTRQMVHSARRSLVKRGIAEEKSTPGSPAMMRFTSSFAEAEGKSVEAEDSAESASANTKEVNGDKEAE